MKSPAELYYQSFRDIEGAADFWKPSHKEAMQVRDLEETIRMCSKLTDAFEYMVADVGRRVAKREILRSSEARGDMITVVEACINAWRALRSNVQKFKEAGYSIDNEAELHRDLRACKRLREYIDRGWPVCNENEFAEGLREIEAGDYVTEEDFMRETFSASR